VRDLTEIERLNLAARAETAKGLLYRNRIPFTFVSAFFVLFAVISTASFYETLAVRLLALLAVATTVMLWLKRRQAVYFLPILLFAVAVGAWLFDDPDYHTFLGSMTRCVISAMLLFVGYRWWTNAAPLVRAQSEAFEKERSQVDQWLSSLRCPRASDNIVELSTRSFLTGDWTYRLLHTGAFWVVAKFKFGNLARLLDCRICGKDDVRVADRPGGMLVVQMGDHSISPVDVSPEMRGRLLHLLDAGTAG